MDISKGCYQNLQMKKGRLLKKGRVDEGEIAEDAEKTAAMARICRMNLFQRVLHRFKLVPV